nr:PREDICTED: protein TASOR isoform X2 [Lepisosteus oculatus]
MATNSSNEAQDSRGGSGIRDGDASVESYDVLRHLLPVSATVTSSQDGEQAGCEGQKLLGEQETAERRRSGMSELKHTSSPSACQRASEEQPRRNFQIPRKNKERKALFQSVPLESREFEDILKIITSCYLESSSAGAFSYTKASLVHSELLEKEFVEKRREMKQEGRTDKELVESYGFLLADRSKLNLICEKGLSVGHSRITTLAKPSMGIYLSKHSDLLQINPFDVGATGDLIIFKVMKGRVKSIYENMSKNVLDPTPKFDCHVSKNASRVTSLFSYRAFELTQQYFYEYSFDEIRKRPRHVCPYAVVSFVYKDKEAAPNPKPMAPLRSNSNSSDGGRDKMAYTVWNGQLLNRGRLLCHVCLKSATRPFLPFKLPEKLDIGTVMSLDQMKRKVPAALLYRDTYTGVREVQKNGMYCSLFDMVEKNKTGNSLASLLHKLEKEKMVLVNPLCDKGFLFLLSSSQMTVPNETKGWRVKCLQALFLFQESRSVLNCAPKKQPSYLDPLAMDMQKPVVPHLDTFIPALHFGLMKMRANPTAALSPGVERHARDYLRGQAEGQSKIRTFVMFEYEQKLDDRRFLFSAPKKKNNIESFLRNYLYSPGAYQLAVARVQEMVEAYRRPQEYSPVSDWEGSDSQNEVAHSGSQANGPQVTADYDQGKLEELLHLIQMRKKHLGEGGKLEGEEQEHEDGSWHEARGLKRKTEEDVETACKYLRTNYSNNGVDRKGEGERSPGFLSSVVDGRAGRDMDVRTQENPSLPMSDTQTLLKLLLDSLTGAVNPGSIAPGGPDQPPEELAGITGLEPHEVPPYDNMSRHSLSGKCDVNLRLQPGGESPGEDVQNNFAEMGGSMSSLEEFSPCSSTQLEQTQHWETEPATEGQMTWKLIPITGIKSHTESLSYRFSQDDNPHDPRFLHRPREDHGSPPKMAHATPPAPPLEESHVEFEEEKNWESGSPGLSKQHSLPRDVDSILSEELTGFSTEVQDLLRRENIYYSSRPAVSIPDQLLGFSNYICSYTSPVPVQSYVSTLREKMSDLIDSKTDHVGLPPASPTRPLKLSPQHHPPESLPRPGAVKERQLSPLDAQECFRRTDLDIAAMHGDPSSGTATEERETLTVDSKDQVPLLGDASSTEDPAESAVLGPAPSSINNLISQLKPEVFSSLVKIIKDVQKNTVKFYIHSEGESEICTEIKEYLMRLGNSECEPQKFLESQNNLDKLLIIIQNEDIATHVHKIPALVSLKKLQSVSFAGVDSLDDVKNHTYNELFVSGGFVVSDEFVLNPDFITYERLECFLKFLEEQSTSESSWQWKVHCKTQKKLKELGRLKPDALSLLNLLTAYQKKHLVEFLPYHECDSPSRHAPDLDCLIKLQAHNTQHRHIIFLTERRFEMFPHYSSNGIMIASIDDFMTSFHSLIGFSCSEEKQLAPEGSSQAPGKVAAPLKDTCVQEDDMSLDSGDNSPVIEEPLQPRPKDGLDKRLSEVDLPPLPKSEVFRPPLPEPPALRESPFPPKTPQQLDFEVLKSAISLFRSSGQKNRWPEEKPAADVELDGDSSASGGCGSFSVNTHQSFLSAAMQSGFSTSPAFPESPTTRELENKTTSSALPVSPPGAPPRSAISQAVWLVQTPTLGAPVTQASQPPAAHRDSKSPCGIPDRGSIHSNLVPLGNPAGETSEHKGSVHAFSPWAAYSASQTVNSMGDASQILDTCSQAHSSSANSASGTPNSQNDGGCTTTASDQGHAVSPVSGTSASGTPNSQGGGTPSSASFSNKGDGKTSTPGSETPNSQGSLTPGPAGDQLKGKATIPSGTVPSRAGSSKGSGPVPPQGGADSRDQARSSSPTSGMSDSQKRGSRGGFRGRGNPSKGHRGRGAPKWQQGTPYGWGYQKRGGHYSHFTEDFCPWVGNRNHQGDRYYPPRDSYSSHRSNNW